MRRRTGGGASDHVKWRSLRWAVRVFTPRPQSVARPCGATFRLNHLARSLLIASYFSPLLLNVSTSSPAFLPGWARVSVCAGGDQARDNAPRRRGCRPPPAFRPGPKADTRMTDMTPFDALHIRNREASFIGFTLPATSASGHHRRLRFIHQGLNSRLLTNIPLAPLLPDSDLMDQFRPVQIMPKAVTSEREQLARRARRARIWAASRCHTWIPFAQLRRTRVPAC